MNWLLTKYYTARYNTTVIKICLNKRESITLAAKMKAGSDYWWNRARLFHLYNQEYRLEKAQKFFKNKLDALSGNGFMAE